MAERDAPTTEDICASDGHPYHSDEFDRGRCYCGRRTYPFGGPHAFMPNREDPR